MMVSDSRKGARIYMYICIPKKINDDTSFNYDIMQAYISCGEVYKTTPETRTPPLVNSLLSLQL